MKLVTRFCRVASAVVLTLHVSGLAASETRVDDLAFEVSVGSFRIADIVLKGEASKGSYTITGSLTSRGIVNWFTRVRYDGSVRGSVSNGRMVPGHYFETTASGDRQASGSITYEDGAPVMTEKSPPAPIGNPRAPIADQSGTLDILTATYLVVRDSEEGEVCDKEFFMYDGTRRSKIEIGEQKIVDDRVHCESKYIRIDGFSQSDLEEQTEFPFQLEYTPMDGREGWFEIVRLTSQTKYGKLVAVRK